LSNILLLFTYLFSIWYLEMQIISIEKQKSLFFASYCLKIVIYLYCPIIVVRVICAHRGDELLEAFVLNKL